MALRLVQRTLLALIVLVRSGRARVLRVAVLR